MKQINILVKPTHQCNMRCKYCFHEKYGYSDELLDVNKFKKFIKLLCGEYDFINVVWHGGEPLLVPLSFTRKLMIFATPKIHIFYLRFKLTVL